ncbi:MAG: response regulator [Candidatus Scalindua sp. AMX11]|nr:MAG: response regulator [Candidatus Scalindua sp.]NOG84409.1 response regulator [Planctomycetota bacterium]RZV72474.1 MAG: response regulator [Candidatus Scalindua sp. SCAELEC01]TDE64629.1 MAG: response regulator [Candidatus Scalindua sp. AMX11]GJQ59727.1 MAG: hypothetical protein SCALA701_25280 [Candidatus Scalindua sp.]
MIDKDITHQPDISLQTIGFFEKLLRASADGIMIADASHNIIVANEAFCEFFQHKRSEIIETDLFYWLEQLGPDAIKIWTTLETTVHTKGICRDVEFNFTTEQYGTRYLSVNASVLERVGIEETGVIVSIWRDVTQQKKAEKKLQLREKQQAVIANIGLFTLSTTDICKLMDEAVNQVAKTLEVEFCKILELLPNGMDLLLRNGVGWNKGLVGNATISVDTKSQAGHSLSSKTPIIVRDYRKETRFNPPKLLKDHGVVSGASVIIDDIEKPYGILGIHTTKQRIFTKDDINFLQSIANILADALKRKRLEDDLKDLNKSLEIRVTNRTNELSQKNKELLSEISERKQMEETLLQSEKLKALGVMSSGVAHEFNNILAIIMGYAQLMQQGYGDHKKLGKSIRVIIEAAKDGAEIVRRMQEFTNQKKDATQYVLVDMKDMIQQAIEYTMPKWKHMAQANGIDYHIDTTGVRETPAVSGNNAELKEVMVNIINNALDAMPEGGTLTFSTWKTNNTVFVSISDTGEGMYEDVQKQIFDPFFSTKLPTGSGLGLSAAYGIMVRHGGKTMVESEVGNGSTFILSLPMSEELSGPSLPSDPTRSFKENSLNILIVDDEEYVCEFLSEFFIDGGHTVQKVCSGKEAIKILQHESFDLLLCDLVMPDITGKDVIKTLDTLDKKPQKVGLITGWNYNVEDADKENVKVDFIIKKPIDFDELLNKINQAFSLSKTVKA